MADTSIEFQGVGSPYRVAYDLYRDLRQRFSEKSEPQAAIDQHLKLYAACRAVVFGGRPELSGIT